MTFKNSLYKLLRSISILYAFVFLLFGIFGITAPDFHFDEDPDPDFNEMHGRLFGVYLLGYSVILLIPNDLKIDTIWFYIKQSVLVLTAMILFYKTYKQIYIMTLEFIENSESYNLLEMLFGFYLLFVAVFSSPILYQIVRYKHKHKHKRKRK